MVFVFKFLQALSGISLVAAVTLYLSPIYQGFYYTFLSLATLAIIFEFGLSIVLPPIASHSFSRLTWGAGGLVTGDSCYEFTTIGKYALFWGFLASISSFAILALAGHFYIANPSLPENGIEVSWFSLMFFTSMTLILSPFYALEEGSGNVSQVYLVRIIQLILGVFTTLLVLYLGGNIYAVPMQAFCSFVVGVLWITFFKHKFLLQIINSSFPNIRIRKVIFNFQWRATVSWAAGYVMVLMYVPLLFKTQGPVVSGQMALTMNVINMTSVLAAAWMIGQLPRIATSIATKKWNEADTLFKKSFLTSIGLYVLGAFAIVALRILLSYTKYDERVLSLLETVVLVIGMGFYHASGLLASYLRAYLKEPMVKVSMIAAVVTAIIAVIIAPRWGSHGIVWLVFFINALFVFPASAYLYIKLREEWQSE